MTKLYSLDRSQLVVIAYYSGLLVLVSFTFITLLSTR